MDRADDERPEVTAPAARKGRPPWANGLLCVAMLPMVGYIGQQGRTLWDEWSTLRGEQGRVRASESVGYIDIHPNISTAECPPDWRHDEGDQTLVWAGWDGASNRWYRFPKGHLDGLDGLSSPIGRDALRAIDRPIFQRIGGQLWGRVPDEAMVAGLDLGEGPTAYPVLVLDKVEVINLEGAGRPKLVVYGPTGGEVSVYDATLEGKRLMMGHSGLFVDLSPVLYDRGGQTIWLGRGDSLVAVAGPRKGSSLPRIARASPVAWAGWKSENPGGRLLVGADRSGDPSDE